MSDYREVARTARSYVIQGMEPKAAWEDAAAKVFKNSASRAKNGYPKSTFLALCSAGVIKGIAAGEYMDRPVEGKHYAVRMIELLREDPDYEDEPQDLFTDGTEGKILKDNGQLDVVFGLWNHGLIEEA